MAFGSQYRQMFFALWAKHAGPVSMRIGPAASRAFAAEMASRGWDWPLDEHNHLLLNRFTASEMPLLAFLLWGEDRSLDIDHWECLALGTRPEMAVPSTQMVRELLSQALEAVHGVEYDICHHEVDQRHIHLYIDLWLKHAGHQFYIMPQSAVNLAVELAEAGFGALPCLDHMHDLPEGTSVSLLTCVAWSESADFRPEDWLS